MQQEGKDATQSREEAIEEVLNDLFKRLRCQIWCDVSDQARVVEARTQLRMDEIRGLAACDRGRLEDRLRQRLDDEEITAPLTSLAGLKTLLATLVSLWRSGQMESAEWSGVGAALDPALEGMSWPLDGRAWDIELDLVLEGLDLYLRATALRPC